MSVEEERDVPLDIDNAIAGPKTFSVSQLFSGVIHLFQLASHHKDYLCLFMSIIELTN